MLNFKFKTKNSKFTIISICSIIKIILKICVIRVLKQFFKIHSKFNYAN